jgi:hypothetical protein
MVMSTFGSLVVSPVRHRLDSASPAPLHCFALDPFNRPRYMLTSKFNQSEHGARIDFPAIQPRADIWDGQQARIRHIRHYPANFHRVTDEFVSAVDHNCRIDR